MPMRSLPKYPSVTVHTRLPGSMPGPISGAAAEPRYPASLVQELGPKCLEQQAKMAFRDSIRNPVVAPTFMVDLEENSIFFPII